MSQENIQEGFRRKAKKYICDERIHEYLKFVDDEGAPRSGVIKFGSRECKDTLASLEAVISSYLEQKGNLSSSSLPPGGASAVHANALILGAAEGIFLLGWNNDMVDSGIVVPETLDSLAEQSLVQSMLREYKKCVIEGVEKDTLMQTTVSFYRGMQKRMQEVMGIADTKKLSDYIRMDVGNEEVTSFLDEENRLIACYDPMTRSNPALIEGGLRPKPRVILLSGRPGTGKTELVHAANEDLQGIARKKNVPVGIYWIDNSFWDKYLGESTRKFKEILDKSLQTNGVGRVILDDVESIIPRRVSESGGESGRRVNREILSYLNNEAGKYRGNVDVIMTTNYDSLIDNALLSRVTHRMDVQGPTKPAHYLDALFLRQLGRLREYISLEERGKESIAEKCASYHFSGRDVEMVATRAADWIRNASSFGSDVFLKTGRDLASAIRKQYRSLGYDELNRFVEERRAWTYGNQIQ